MSSEPPRVPDAVLLAIGLTLSVLAFLVTYTHWPLPPGPDTGGPSLAPFLILLFTIFGGALTGAGLSRYIPFSWVWLRTVALGLICIAGVMTIIVIYGQRVAPGYWGYTSPNYYRTVLSFGGVLLIVMGFLQEIVKRRRQLRVGSAK